MKPSAGKRLRPHVGPTADSTRGSPFGCTSATVGRVGIDSRCALSLDRGVATLHPLVRWPLRGSRNCPPVPSRGRRDRESPCRFDWIGAGLRPAPFDRRCVLSRGLDPRWRDLPRRGRHLSRPVLKHGPRSLTHPLVRRTEKPEGEAKAKESLVDS